jgi:hypothetical protein
MNKAATALGVTLLLFGAFACRHERTTTQPKAAVAPITLSPNLTTINVCLAVPTEDIQAVMGRELVKAPKRFEYYDSVGTSGCTYDAGKDSEGGAHFGYVVLTPASVYASQPLYKNIAVSGLGKSAYFNNGADARQLWVKVNDQVALVVAFGDEPNESGATAMAKLILAAIR